MRLTIENLSFRYGGREVLHEISFAAEEGELLAILGPNGVGKTTLFKCVMGLERPCGGRVALIPQAHPLSFRYSVFDMVLMGTSHSLSPLALPGERERAAARGALERLGISSLADRPFDRLSGGEQQLVFVARALAQQAKVLLMDEPTASLDYGNRLRVLGAARDLARDGYTVLLSTHDPQHALWFADRALALHRGRILAYGAPREVVTADLLQQLYGRRIALIDTAQGPVVVPQEGD